MNHNLRTIACLRLTCQTMIRICGSGILTHTLRSVDKPFVMFLDVTDMICSRTCCARGRFDSVGASAGPLTVTRNFRLEGLVDE